MRYVILPLALILSLVACKKTPPANAAGAATSGQAGQAAAAPAPAPAKPVPDVLPEGVAKVNGEAIGKTEFEQALKSVEARAGGPIPADRKAEIYRNVLDQLVAMKLLASESKTRNISVPDAEVDKRIAQVRQQFPSEEVFKQQLTAQGMTLDRIKQDARTSMQIEALLQAEVAPKVQVTAADIDAFYKANPDQFKQPESVRASHILIRPTADTPEAKKQAQAKAAQVLKDAKAGKDFAALAKANSSDPGSAPQGGDLGFFPRGQMVPEFDQAAFSLAPGGMSGLVETQFGYHIIKVVEKKPERVVPLDEVKTQLEQFLQARQREEKTTVFIDSLKGKNKVEIFI